MTRHAQGQWPSQTAVPSRAALDALITEWAGKAREPDRAHGAAAAYRIAARDLQAAIDDAARSLAAAAAAPPALAPEADRAVYDTASDLWAGGIIGSPSIPWEEMTPEERAGWARIRQAALTAQQLQAPPSLVYGEATCAADVTADDEGEEYETACGALSRFVVSRSDGDKSFGAGGGTEEACEKHLAATAAGMVNGDESVCAVVVIRWDKDGDGR